MDLSHHASFAASLQGYEKTSAGILVKNPEQKEPTLGWPQRGLEYSFPSCGNLLELMKSQTQACNPKVSGGKYRT